MAAPNGAQHRAAAPNGTQHLSTAPPWPRGPPRGPLRAPRAATRAATRRRRVQSRKCCPRHRLRRCSASTIRDQRAAATTGL
eukprot:7204068-Prymnesium_polylepis.2